MAIGDRNRVEVGTGVYARRLRSGLVSIEVWTAAPDGRGAWCDEVVLPDDALVALGRYLIREGERDGSEA